MTTPKQESEIRKRCEAAIAGKWHEAGNCVRDEHDHDVAEVLDEIPWKRYPGEVWTPEETEAGRKKRSLEEVCATAEFIAREKEDVLDLLDTIEALRKQRDGVETT